MEGLAITPDGKTLVGQNALMMALLLATRWLNLVVR